MARLMNWRIAITEAGLANGSMMARNIGVPLQIEPEDHSTETPQSEGGVAHTGFKKYKILWKDLDEEQASNLRKLVADARSTSNLIYITGRWYDEANPFTRWVDFRGKPSLDKMAPAPPETRRGKAVYSNVVLNINNVFLINDPASF